MPLPPSSFDTIALLWREQSLRWFVDKDMFLKGSHKEVRH